MQKNIDVIENNNLVQTQKNIQTKLDFYEDLLYRIYTNDEIVKLIDNINAGNELEINNNRLRHVLHEYIYTMPYIQSITILMSSGKMAFDDILTGYNTKTSWLDTSGDQPKQLFRQISSEDNVKIMSSQVVSYFSSKKYYLFHIAHRIIDYKNIYKKNGVVILSIDETMLSEICSEQQNEINDYDKSCIIILGTDGTVISYLDKSRIGTRMHLPEEPEFTKYEYSNYRYWRGSDLEIGNLYPKEYAKMAYEGMQSEGQKNIMNLIRCAWAGNHKYGPLLWSGDIDSSFRALREQVAAGLNTGIAGIPWWTTDIGGFHGGNIESEEFRGCLVRWFQFGTFCPVMRLHVDREPHKEPLGTTMPSGADNEVWSFGDDVYQICKKYLFLREKMRPYLMELMKKAHEKGSPVIRPLFYDFLQDDKAWSVEDEYMLGESLIVCPVLYQKQSGRKVYLPKRTSWRDIHSGKLYDGGTLILYDTPMDVIPVFAKKGHLAEITM